MSGETVDLRELEAFLAVADELHFGRAAERLRVAQPSVSQLIRKLERGLGVRLFERTSRRVELTAAGHRLLPEARAVLAALDRATAAARGTDGESLRLGTADLLGERLDRLLDLFAARAPTATVTLSLSSAGERLRRIRTGDLDAALVRAAAPGPGIALTPLWTDPLVIALPAGHPLAGQPRLRLADMADLPLRLVPREQNATFVDQVVTACHAAGFSPIYGPRFGELQESLAEIGANPASWTVLYAATARLAGTRRVAFRPLADPGLAVTTSLATRPNPTGLVHVLLDAALELAMGDTGG